MKETAYQKQYRLDNKEKIKEYQRAYHKKNYKPKLNGTTKFNSGSATVKSFSSTERQFRLDNPNLTILYYLPEEHYIGITTCKQFNTRMQQHRTAGKYTADVEVLGFYKRRVDAHLQETKLHCIGYYGFRDLIRK
jgi:hypothetical protein